MAKARSGPPRSMFVVSGSANHAPHPDGTVPAPSGSDGRELIIGGRRYRLVPVESAPQPGPVRSWVAVERLTARELQIVALVAEGRVNKQIADDLRISEWTVSTHLRRIFAKLGVDTRAAMVSRCLRPLASASGRDAAAP